MISQTNMTFFPIRGRRWHRLAALLILVGNFAFVAKTSAQTNATTVPENRWLLIIETSRGMEKSAEGSHQFVASLVASGMNGQMHRGDTLGLWTFNDALHNGEFPLQRWTPETAGLIARRVYEYLKTQKSEKDGRLAKVVPEMNRIIKDSDYITVILVSDGSSPMRGTSVDDAINASFKDWQDQQKKNQMPFVTVLRARSGTITDHLVNTPPFPLELPELPEELAKVVPEPKPAEVEKAKPAIVPPLILSGKKLHPTNAEPTPAPAAPANLKFEGPTNVPTPTNPSAPVEVKAPAQPTTPEPITKAEKSAPENPPVVVAKPEPQKETVAEKAEAAASETKPAVQPTATIEGVTAVQTEPVWKRKSFLVAAGAIFLAALGATLFILLRPRNTAQASLITRSLDRDKK